MNSNESEQTQKRALDNYSSSEPWPDNDGWHFFTNKILSKKVQELLNQHCSNQKVILNAGCGKTTYNVSADMIYMDIVKEYVKNFPNYIVGSVEDIPLEDCSIDCIVCVGSVVNYADIQKVISEFSRILKNDGIVILEFERSNSAEFLFTKKHGKTVFKQKYYYNNQEHLLWMYGEKFVEKLCEFYNLPCIYKYRFHIFSSLLYRFGIAERKAAKHHRLDSVLQLVGYPFSHNVILVLRKTTPL